MAQLSLLGEQSLYFLFHQENAIAMQFFNISVSGEMGQLQDELNRSCSDSLGKEVTVTNETQWVIR